MENNKIDDFFHSFRAEDWARAFCHYYNTNPNFKIDEGTMIGWFANSLMRGYDEYHWREEKAKQDSIDLENKINKVEINDSYDKATIDYLKKSFELMKV
jgi:hypothetical protein